MNDDGPTNEAPVPALSPEQVQAALQVLKTLETIKVAAAAFARALAPVFRAVLTVAEELASNPQLLAALKAEAEAKPEKVSTNRLRKMLGGSPTDGAAAFDGEGKIRAVQCRAELSGDFDQGPS